MPPLPAGVRPSDFALVAAQGVFVVLLAVLACKALSAALADHCEAQEAAQDRPGSEIVPVPAPWSDPETIGRPDANGDVRLRFRA